MRERFVIRRGVLYLQNHPSLHHWTTNLDDAMKFEFMVIADGTAIMELGLQITDYEVISVTE